MAGACGTHKECGKIIQSVVEKARISQFSATNEKPTHTTRNVAKCLVTLLRILSTMMKKHLSNGTKFQGRDVLRILSESFLALWR
jgi:hypothetical protein